MYLPTLFIPCSCRCQDLSGGPSESGVPRDRNCLKSFGQTAGSQTAQTGIRRRQQIRSLFEHRLDHLQGTTGDPRPESVPLAACVTLFVPVDRCLHSRCKFTKEGGLDFDLGEPEDCPATDMGKLADLLKQRSQYYRAQAPPPAPPPLSLRV